MHSIAGKAVAFHEAMQPAFRDYQSRVLGNAQRLAASLMGHGLRLVSGGTDNHLMLIDVKASGISGKEAQERLARAGITVNKNTIPFDTEKPTVTSGIRIGTPQVTTRGLTESDMDVLGEIIAAVVLAAPGQSFDALARRVRDLAQSHPLPGVDAS
jgi:glycine hydroxymethyltransferase